MTWLKICVVILAIISPPIMIYFEGFKPSISSYWMTDLQPLFIITNAATSYFLFSTKSWQIPAIFLLGLTAFSVEKFELLHNVLAILFFIITILSLYSIRRLRFVIWIYLGALLFLLHSITLAEIWAILVLCIYHLTLLLTWKNIHSHKNK